MKTGLEESSGRVVYNVLSREGSNQDISAIESCTSPPSDSQILLSSDMINRVDVGPSDESERERSNSNGTGSLHGNDPRYLSSRVSLSNHSMAPATGQLIVLERDGSVSAVLNLVRVPAVAVCLCFSFTIAIFPSILVKVESQSHCDTSNRFSNDLFVPFMFTLFGVFDVCGRVLAEKVKSFLSVKNIVHYALLRFILIPCIFLCNISGSRFPVVFTSDWAFMTLLAVFALSNGYIASSAMMMGPALVSSKDADLAGTIMIFALTLGLFFGGILSFLSVYISQGSIT